MYVKQSVIACLLTTAFVAGCSGGGDDNSDTASSEIAGQISTSLSGSDTNSGRGTVSKYNGNYVTDCTFKPDSRDSVSENDYWAIAESTVQSDSSTVTTTVYVDEECTQPSHTIVSRSLLEYPGGTVNTSLGVADHVNTTNESITLNGVTLPTTPSKGFQ